MTTVATPPRDPLVARLQELAEKEDRAALAALRRGLGREPGTVAEMYPYVEPFMPSDAGSARDPRVAAAYLVASLFGLHPVHADTPEGPARRTRGGLGTPLRQIRHRPDTNDEDAGIARRFVALLECNREALPVHLRHLVTLLHSRAEAVPIDYRQLRLDILDWDAEDRRVQRAWAAGFWGGREQSEDQAGADQPPAASNDDDDNN
jgi:CRISPR system Cascade subunit CasB